MSTATASTNDQRVAAIAGVCGLLFGIGLGISGMTSPAKVLGFLDVTSSAWDPSLAFVMAGAIGVHVLFARYAARAGKDGKAPLAAPRFFLPEKTTIDRPLLFGAALFGVGWGLSGICPGPGIVSFMVTPTAVAFVGAMLVGMWGTHVVRAHLELRRLRRELPPLR